MYLSRRAQLYTRLIAEDAVVLGPSVVGEDTILDRGVVVGYPSRASMRRVLAEGEPTGSLYELLDRASRGSRIGRSCHLRPGTVVYEGSILGDRVETGHNVLIREEVVVGEGTLIGSYSVVDGRARIGRNVRIETGVYLPPGTVVGDNVFLGPFVVVTNDRYPPSRRLEGVVIEDNAVVGANAVLIAGIRVGENAVVAAGSVVTRDVPPNTVVRGVPARPVAKREEYEEKKRAWEQAVGLREG